MIKGSLSDGLLKALDTKPKVEQKVDTTKPEAYEFYLKAKHIYDKRENTEDTELVRGLIYKAIEIDDNLIYAKLLLGRTYHNIGEYDKAMEVYTLALKQTEQLGDKRGMGASLNNIGIIHGEKDDHGKALDCHGRSLAIKEELGDKQGIGHSLANIGIVHHIEGDLDKALDCVGRSLAICEELGDKRGMGGIIGNIGTMHKNKGDYGKALDYYNKSLAIKEELGNKYGTGHTLGNIGLVYLNKGENEKALNYFNRALTIGEELDDKYGVGVNLFNIGLVYLDKGDFGKTEEYLEKYLSIEKEIGLESIGLETTAHLYLAYKHLGKHYDINEIHSLIKEAENIGFEVNYQLFKLLEDTSYLETAYNQVQEKSDNLEPDVAAKFLSYPIPKAIVEAWERVK